MTEKVSKGLEVDPNRSNLFECCNLFFNKSAKEIVDDLICGIDVDIKYYERLGYDSSIEIPSDPNGFMFELTQRTLARPLFKLFEDKESGKCYLQLTLNPIFVDGKILTDAIIYNDGRIVALDSNGKEAEFDSIKKSYNIIKATSQTYKRDCYGFYSLNSLRGKVNEDSKNDFITGCKILGIEMNIDEKDFNGMGGFNEDIMELNKVRTFKFDNPETFDENLMNIVYSTEQTLNYADTYIVDGFTNQNNFLVYDAPLVIMNEKVNSGSIVIEHYRLDNPFETHYNVGSDFVKKVKPEIMKACKGFTFFTTFLAQQEEMLIDFKKSM